MAQRFSSKGAFVRAGFMVAVSVLAAACGGGSQQPAESPEAAPAPAGETGSGSDGEHTMPDGTKMEGESHGEHTMPDGTKMEGESHGSGHSQEQK